MTVPVQLGEVDADRLARARRAAVARALAEDLGDVGDVTTAATVPATATGSARLVARADGVLAGLDVVREVFEQVDPRVEVDLHVRRRPRSSAATWWPPSAGGCGPC